MNAEPVLVATVFPVWNVGRVDYRKLRSLETPFVLPMRPDFGRFFFVTADDPLDPQRAVDAARARAQRLAEQGRARVAEEKFVMERGLVVHGEQHGFDGEMADGGMCVDRVGPRMRRR
jgi:hypothetical protein